MAAKSHSAVQKETNGLLPRHAMQRRQHEPSLEEENPLEKVIVPEQGKYSFNCAVITPTQYT